MRKSAKYFLNNNGKKLLAASVMALLLSGSAQLVLAASAEILDGTANDKYAQVNSGDIYGTVYGVRNDADASGGTIKMNEGAAFNLYGGLSFNKNEAKADYNVVTINNGKVVFAVYGGQAQGHDADASGNIVSISGSNSELSFEGGAHSAAGGFAQTYSANTSVTANNNVVAVTGGLLKAGIAGGYILGNHNAAAARGEANGNIVFVGGNAKVNGWHGSVKTVDGFNNVVFKEVAWQDNGKVLNITDGENTSLEDAEIDASHIHFDDASDINDNDSMILIHIENGKDELKSKNIQSGNFTAGVAVEGDGEAKVENGDLVYQINGIHAAKQTKLVAENRAVAAAFINQGTDLISDSLDALSRDDSYGIKTFAAVQGNRSKYDVNSDIKINGWSTIVGVGNAEKFSGGDEVAWGVFYENGSGNYRTYNEFNDEFFRGDGSLVYNGGGVAARYENAHSVYTEGSLRAGMLKSEMDNALHDGSGAEYGYDSSSAYYGAHIGIGQVIQLSDDSSVDVYGKFFHTYTEGDNFSVGNDKFEFDSINSDRLRIGARVTTNKENKFRTYYGLAYEYEFNGRAGMRAAGMEVPEQSLRGSSYMAEAGLNYQPSADSPWSFDLNMRGYAGERQGASFNVQATYTF